MNPLFRHVNQLELVDLLERYEKRGSDSVAKIAILRNISTEPLLSYLRYRGYISGISIAAHMCLYDNIIAEANNPGGDLYAFNPDFILVVAHLSVLSPLLWYDFASAQHNTVKTETERVAGIVQSIIQTVRERSAAIIIINGFDVPVFPAGGIHDFQNSDGQVNTIRALNRTIRELCRRQSSTCFIDMEILNARAGDQVFHDPRYWHIGHIPYSPYGWDMLAAEYAKIICDLKGKTKKCLVLDCDNTLWGGIVGEAGMSGIALDVTHPGSMFVEFQKAILALQREGVILALCSKNNEADVLEVLDNHPYMVLRREHFSAMRINWNDKVTNLRSIADELNIGLDAFVFVDDSSFEINLVRQALPSVTCILLPEDSSQYRDIILSCGLFEKPIVSEEDRRKSELYAQEAARKTVRRQFGSADIAEYLRSLNQIAVVSLAEDFAFPRISQLTQKTNQFNLTTRRYSEAQIRNFAASSSSEVLYMSLKDDFGESGIVGAAILLFSGESATIDTFLLSCRVIGRDADAVLLAAVVERSVSRQNVKKIIGNYRPTPKNEQVRDFYLKFGFTAEGGDGEQVAYHLCVYPAVTPRYPTHYKAIAAFGKNIIQQVK